MSLTSEEFDAFAIIFISLKSISFPKHLLKNGNWNKNSPSGFPPILSILVNCGDFAHSTADKLCMSSIQIPEDGESIEDDFANFQVLETIRMKIPIDIVTTNDIQIYLRSLRGPVELSIDYIETSNYEYEILDQLSLNISKLFHCQSRSKAPQLFVKELQFQKCKDIRLSLSVEYQEYNCQDFIFQDKRLQAYQYQDEGQVPTDSYLLLTQDSAIGLQAGNNNDNNNNNNNINNHLEAKLPTSDCYLSDIFQLVPIVDKAAFLQIKEKVSDYFIERERFYSRRLAALQASRDSLYKTLREEFYAKQVIFEANHQADERLRQYISKIRSEMSHMSVEYAEIAAKLDRIEYENIMLREQLLINKESIFDLNSILQSSSATISASAMKRALVEEENDTLAQELINCKVTIAELNSRLDEEAMKNSILRKNIDTYMASAAQEIGKENSNSNSNSNSSNSMSTVSEVSSIGL